MKKKLLLILSCLLLSIGYIAAQTTKITGTVIDTNGEPVISASVVVKGTTVGTVTDLDGTFSINVPDGKNTLVFNLVGMKSIETKATQNMRVVMENDDKLLDEVVVTAMGIQRDQKILGYAATQVKSDEISAAKSGSVMGGLNGKIAGVNISASGPAGTSQKVLIRGISSFNSNNPLYIVDGVPITNERSGTNYADFGNSANDINAEDVESVTVLKGASATALYGSRAGNGVIMITTKRAKNEKLTITYDGAFTASNVLRVMQTQDLYGQGWGAWDRAENGSWGPRLDGSIHEWGSDQLDEVMTKPFSYVKNNIRNFYKTGHELNNVVSLRYGTDNLGLYASYGNVTSNGTLPNNADTYSRNTFSLRGNAKWDKLSVDVSINYARKDIRRTEQMEIELLQNAVDIDIASMKNYNDERYNLNNYYTFYATNPYWMVDNNYFLYQDNHTYGKLEASYQLLSGLKATGRLGGDFLNYNRENINAKNSFIPGSYSDLGGATAQNGYYSNYRFNRDQLDATAFLTADYKFSDFSFGGSAGWNLNQRTYNYTGGYVDGLGVSDWYSLENTASGAISQQYSEKRRLIGVFAQAEIGYKNFLYLNLSARNDYSSTLPKDNNSYFYGGGNLSFVLTELFPALKNNKIDFLKLRAAIGQTGNDAEVYRTSSWFEPVTGSNSTYNYTWLPINGILGLTEYNRLPSQSLKPEITTEYEFGVQGNFFDNRVHLDFAYYNKRSKNQIINATLAPETGYTSETRNVGELENKGVEIAAGITPIRTKDWQWDVNATFTKNTGKVIELWDGLQEYNIYSWRGIEYRMKVGEKIGTFQVPSVDRVTDKTSPYYGYMIVNANGFPTQSTTEKEVIGSSQPDFILGLNTSVKFKDFRLTVVGDWHKGGWMASNTSYITHFNGNSTQTVYNERNSFIYPNSVKIIGGQYVENNIPVMANQMNYTLGNYSYNPLVRNEMVIPKDFFKIREVTLSYDLPKKVLTKTPLNKVTLSFIGRNLFLFTPKKNNYVDPEVANMGNDLNSEFGEISSGTSYRSFGGAIKVEF
ncbi:MAG: SusC/RagA family TonB-linked outer membrane protein [Dysgonomonas mossii]|uniref:SusC/RagA family TonB-linked outer membrane protein n=1 Tax=Dysgonomonas mossii TaxID=163665 RepID=UPI0026EBA1E8|nr:SusC/RagA family TonB-linked outer membrane protein [Dysgonomonas mossii]MBS5908882.1 SusC/RagA family TonB-linked outer membrane protein [Dysgonomonas mossii]